MRFLKGYLKEGISFRRQLRRFFDSLERLLSQASGIFVTGYRIFVSPFLGSRCRFSPSCSQYAREAFERHGFFRGLVIAGARLLRCHPFGRSGYDPVLK